MIELHNKDAAEVCASMADGSIECIITDPPWVGGEAAQLIGHDDADAAFARVAAHFSRIARRVVVVLADHTPPDVLRHVKMPFFRVCWLEYAVPGYRGRLLRAANVAYVFGEPPPSVEGRRVIPGRTISTTNKRQSTIHPCPLKPCHCAWLVHWFADDLVFDPFMGSGAIGAAARMQGKSFIGCELDPAYFNDASQTIRDAQPLYEPAAV